MSLPTLIGGAAPDDLVLGIDVSDTSPVAPDGTAKLFPISALPALTGLGPSGDEAGAADLSNITGLLNLTGRAILQAGHFYIDGALTVNSGSCLLGAGIDATRITQLSTTAHGIQGTDVEYVTLRDFELVGPGSGSASGVHLVRSAEPSIPYCTFSGVQASSWGNCGFYVDVMIVSSFTGCIAHSNGGDGFQLNSTAGNTTSVTFTACYANNNTGTGFELDSAVYCAFNGCAADTNGYGAYALYSANGCSLNACGAEANTSFAVMLSGGTGNSVTGLWVNVNSGIGISVAGGETGATLTGCVEHSASGATAFIQTAAGTSAVVINDEHTTANNFASGTAYEILPTGAATH